MARVDSADASAEQLECFLQLSNPNIALFDSSEQNRGRITGLSDLDETGGDGEQRHLPGPHHSVYSARGESSFAGNGGFGDLIKWIGTKD
jgi:hypothetical protein